MDKYAALDVILTKAAILKLAEENGISPEDVANALSQPEVAEEVAEALEEQKSAMLSEIVDENAIQKVAGVLGDIMRIETKYPMLMEAKMTRPAKALHYLMTHPAAAAAAGLGAIGAAGGAGYYVGKRHREKRSEADIHKTAKLTLRDLLKNLNAGMKYQLQYGLASDVKGAKGAATRAVLRLLSHPVATTAGVLGAAGGVGYLAGRRRKKAAEFLADYLAD